MICIYIFPSKPNAIYNRFCLNFFHLFYDLFSLPSFQFRPSYFHLLELLIRSYVCSALFSLILILSKHLEQMYLVPVQYQYV